MIRRELVPRAKGLTLEIGMGSGLNLPFYDPSRIDLVLGLEPMAKLRQMAEKKALKLPFDVDFIGLSGEDIPLADNSVDTVLITYTLCSIPDAPKALKEMQRVLKPRGELIFCEHGKSPDEHIFKWQNRLNPPWTKISGGCHLNRHISGLIQASGFKIVALDAGYNSPLKLLSYNYKGIAVPG
nr:class I SAM-dependent methyltransferase [Desulforapulum autotrophicum]